MTAFVQPGQCTRASAIGSLAFNLLSAKKHGELAMGLGPHPRSKVLRHPLRISESNCKYLIFILLGRDGQEACQLLRANGAPDSTRARNFIEGLASAKVQQARYVCLLCDCQAMTYISSQTRDLPPKSLIILWCLEERE